MITLTIALRNIFRHKTRSLITLSTIIFGCSALIFAGGFFEDIFHKMRESYIQAHTGHIQIFKKGFSDKGRIDPYTYLIENPEETIAHIKTIKGIKFVASHLQFSGLISTGENTIAFMGMGLEPKYEKTTKPDASNLRNATKSLTLSGVIVAEGDALAENDTSAVMLGKGLASAIGAKNKDVLVLLTHTVNGSVNAMDITVKGIFYTSSQAYDDHFLRLPLPSAQKLLATESVQSLIVMLDKTEDTQRIKSELTTLFRKKNLALELKSWDEINDFYAQTVKLFNRLFLVLKIVITIIVILSIFNTMNMAVLERIDEIGTIMALGTKAKGVMQLFIYEGLCLGGIGGILGIIFGVIVTSLISRIGIPMPAPPGATMPWLSEPKVVFSMLFFSFALSLLTSIISSLYPAYRASQLQIADALRHK